MKITDTPMKGGETFRAVEFDSLEDVHRVVREDVFHCPPAHLENNRQKFNTYKGNEETQGSWRVGKYGLTAADWHAATTHPQLDRFTDRFKRFGTGEYLGQSMNKRRHRVFTEEDGEYIVERAGSDRPFESQRFHLEQTNRRGQVDLLVEIGGNCGLENEQLEMSGLAASVLSDRLENDGFRVRIMSLSYVMDTSTARPCVRSIILKRHDEPLDIGRVGLVVGCGPFYRVPMFLALTKTAIEINHCLGRAIEIAGNHGLFKHLDLSPTVILVPRMITEQQAIEFVKQQTKHKWRPNELPEMQHGI